MTPQLCFLLVDEAIRALAIVLDQVTDKRDLDVVTDRDLLASHDFRDRKLEDLYASCGRELAKVAPLPVPVHWVRLFFEVVLPYFVGE